MCFVAAFSLLPSEGAQARPDESRTTISCRSKSSSCTLRAMAQKIRIRDIQASDRAAWEELWNAYLQFYKQYLPREVTEFTWSRLLDSREPLSGFVAVDNEERLLGFVHHHIHLSTWSPQGYCYLEDLYVDSAARGLGAGRALIEAVYEWAD